MMTLLFFVLFTYVFFMSSFHSLLMLMLVEFLILLSFYLIVSSHSSWVMGLMFLFVGVCLGSYGVSLLVSLFRSNGSFYIFGFKTF